MKILYEGGRFAGKLTLVGKILGKILGKPLRKITPLVGQVMLGYEIGKEIKKHNISSIEKEIFEKINEYDSFDAIPDDVREELRQMILRNEIDKRRKLFQGIGYDLDTFDMGLWDRFVMSNLTEDSPFRENMRDAGTFREAVFAANRKLVLLGFQPFEIK